MDFGHSEDTVVSQADIALEESAHEAGIAMDFDHIDEQPILMDTGSEEIIGSFIFLSQNYKDLWKIKCSTLKKV